MRTLRKLSPFICLILIFLSGNGHSSDQNLDTQNFQSIVRKKIFQTVKKNLPAKYKGRAHAVTATIMGESKKHKLDPFILTAVIAGESSFNPEAVGPVGELGLMQVRPTTGQWIAKKMNLPWYGQRTLKDPIKNIRIGAAYLSYLHKRLGDEGGLLYLAAYNMGLESVLRLRSKKVHPKIYSSHVMSRYITLNDSDFVNL